MLLHLTQSECEIIKLRFETGKKRDYTLDEIGKEFNPGRERVRQILEVAFNKLRNSKNTKNQMTLLIPINHYFFYNIKFGGSMHKNINHDSNKNFFVKDADHFQKGQRILYEGEDAEVIKATPFLVIKTANRLICGALHEQCAPRSEKYIHN